MGHYARGDSRKMICSSDEDEGYRGTLQRLSRTNSITSQRNMRDKRNLIFGTFGEAPPVPLPPVSDETDRQFWAEDELSSSESKNLMVTRRKRKRSVAYRNRAAFRKSRSDFVLSSSSGTETARVNIPPSVRKRRKLQSCPGPSRVKSSRVPSGGALTRVDTRTVSRSVTAGNDLASKCQLATPNGQDRGFLASILSNRGNGETNDATDPQNTNIPSRTPSKSDTCNVRRKRISKLRPLMKYRRG